jgi:hypothetical protein
MEDFDLICVRKARRALRPSSEGCLALIPTAPDPHRITRTGREHIGVSAPPAHQPVERDMLLANDSAVHAMHNENRKQWRKNHRDLGLRSGDYQRFWLGVRDERNREPGVLVKSS